MARRPIVDPAVLAEFPGRAGETLPAHLGQDVRYRGPPSDLVAAALVDFLREGMNDLRPLGLRGLAVGFSGGLDSVVCVRLAQLAARHEEPALAVIVDLGREGERERVEANRAKAEDIGVEHVVVAGAPTRREALAAWTERGTWSPINIDTRLIQHLIFQVADGRGHAVVATTDRSERVLGRFTEHFYGHLEPLGGLYKTEVSALAEHLGVATLARDTEPGCEDYWLDLDVLGAPYEVLDPLLHLIAVEGLDGAALGARLGIPSSAWLDRLVHRVRANQHRIVTRRPS